jgi:hypothetical protein
MAVAPAQEEGIMNKVLSKLSYTTFQKTEIKWNYESTEPNESDKKKAVFLVRASILLYYGLLLFLLCFVIGNNIIKEKGYQFHEPVVGTANARLKGATLPIGSTKVHDARDLLYPAREAGGFFLTSNYDVIQKQRRSKCGDNIPCSSDDDCAGMPSLKGIKTGKCVSNLCEVSAWCPIEATPASVAVTKSFLMPGVLDFLVQLKGKARFPKFDVNVATSTNMTVEKILEKAGFKILPERPVAKYGAVVYIEITYDCNLDIDHSLCKPKFRFSRIDDKDEDDPKLKGYSFRHARYFFDGNGATDAEKEMRDVHITKGFRVVFDIGGVGRKWSWAALGVNIGAGLGLLAAASLATDTVLKVIRVGGSGKSLYDTHVRTQVESDLNKIDLALRDQGLVDESKLLENKKKNRLSTLVKNKSAFIKKKLHLGGKEKEVDVEAGDAQPNETTALLNKDK